MPDWTYHPFFKPLMFRLPPESARRLTLRVLEVQARTRLGRRVFRLFGHGLPPARLSVDVFGLRFPGPVGLGPGIDTAGTTISVMQHLGFGFLEVGPVGANARPRTFETDPLRITARHTLAHSLRAGGPSAAELSARVRSAPEVSIPIGMALRNGTVLQLVNAIRDASDGSSFFTLPASCADDLTCFNALRAATTKPLLLRLAPEWTNHRLDEILEAMVVAGLDGCVAVGGAACALLPDGEMDGPFLLEHALRVTAHVSRKYGERLPVVGAGGVMSPDDVLALLDAGARLVELYAGLVYAGPGLPGRIVHALEHRLEHAHHHDAAPLNKSDEASAPCITPASDASGAMSSDASAHGLHDERAISASFPAKQKGLWRMLAGLNWQLLAFTGWVLIASGLFAFALAATVNLLPYDVHYLGMTVNELHHLHGGRILHFMAHDRVSFGGSIIAIGALYVWLASSPLRRGEAWAWWVFLISGVIGFGSFLTYLGYGYLDVTHGIATLMLVPFFVVGLIRAFSMLRGPRGIRSLLKPGARAWAWSPAGMGRACLLFTAAGMILGGAIIMTVGMTRVFVPQDLEFMRVTVADLQAINPRLVPLIAHDRSGFGGGLCSTGLTILLTVWCGARPRARGLWRALLLAGLVGFTTAIGIHPIVGYVSFVHLAPAYIGALAFLVGIILLRKPMCCADRSSDRFPDL